MFMSFYQEKNQYNINTKSKHFHIVLIESTYLIKAWAFVDVDVLLIFEFVTFITIVASLQLMKAWAFADVDVSLIFEFMKFTTTAKSLRLMKAWAFGDVDVSLMSA